MNTKVYCPECQHEAPSFQTAFGIRHQCCGLWSWGGKPLVDQSTHDARKAAHVAFDELWINGPLTRAEAYRHLAAELRLDETSCHMSAMDHATAKRVPGAVARIRARISVVAS